MSTPKKHHYVSQFLLKNFQRLPHGQLFVYDTQKEEIRAQKINDVACESNLYSIQTDGKLDRQLEAKFSQIESKAAKVIKKFTKQIALSEKEREDLARFIALTRIRTPSFINNLGKLVETYKDIELFKKTGEIDFTQERTRYISRGILLKHPFFWDYWEFLEKNILSLKWCLFEAPNNRTFITSDNPLCSIPKISDSHKNGLSIIHEFKDSSLRLYLPLSKTHAWLGLMDLDKDNYYQADDAWMDMFERNCIIWAARYVYTSIEDRNILKRAIAFKDIHPFGVNPLDKPSKFVPPNVKVNRVSEKEK